MATESKALTPGEVIEKEYRSARSTPFDLAAEIDAARKPVSLEECAEAVLNTSITISSTRRSGQNGIRNPHDVAKAVLDAAGVKYE